MKKYSKFIYHGYEITDDGFTYHFSLKENEGEEGAEHHFRPKWTAGTALKGLIDKNDILLQTLVFNLGMAELVSYWKAAVPPIVEIQCGTLDEWQKEWWKELYLNGLGEFFYTNGITPTDDFMTIVCTADASGQQPQLPLSCNKKLSGCLIPVGGGKDSIVTLELLKENTANNADNLCYIVGDIKRAYNSAKTAGYNDEHIVKVQRTIDPVLIELNRRGYLNGHTPFSSVIAFSSLVFAYLTNKKYIVLSNESSADEGNVENSDVNHQYSKSSKFEEDFREYTDRVFADNKIEYFSLLRPWNELQITQRFMQYPQYFPVFQSCNVGTKTNTWCCNCAKCLYVYIMMAAFADDSVLIEAFGENLLEKAELADLLNALANPQYDKPFECVGTREEVNAALYMAVQRRKDKLPLLLRGAEPRLQPNERLLHSFNETHFVPDEFSCVFYNDK